MALSKRRRPARDGSADAAADVARPVATAGAGDGAADEATEGTEVATEGTGRGGAAGDRPRRRATRRPALATAWPVLLARTAHPRQGLLTALGVAVAAALAGRSAREVGLVLATVLVGQAVLGWHNDLVDRDRDRRHQRTVKPIAEGRLEAGTVWFALGCGVLLVIPLAVSSGVTAGSAYLLSVVLGLLGNVVLRKGLLSWLTWSASYALLPAFLSYGGWGGTATGAPPTVLMTVLAALLGLGAHVLCALPGLVPDHEDGWRTLPLRIALRTGAPRLLVIALAWTALVLAAMLVTGSQLGLTQ